MTTPAPPFQSHSVPTSPATARSGKGQPITPQRQPSRHHHRHSQSSSFRSPNTPSSPYTPLSLRSSESATSSSSALTTPDNVSFLTRNLKRLGNGRSPDIRNVSVDSIESRDRGAADLTQNWRARASQHGIKVASSNNGGVGDVSHYGDDEASDKTSSDLANDSSMLSTDEALLPPAYMSYQRRSASHSGVGVRPRALSHASLPENRVPDGSPIASRNANTSMPLMSSPVRARRTLASVGNLMSTPPPNRALSSELKLKGSLTEPAQPRRREAFAPVPALSNSIPRGSTSMTLNLNHDTSLDLFNINEHDYEHENDLHSNEDLYDESFSLDLQSHTANIFGYSSAGPNEGKASSNQQTGFADPFYEAPSGYGHHVLNTISESAEHQFHATAQPQINLTYPQPNIYASGEPVFAYSLPKRQPNTAQPAPRQNRSVSAPVQLPATKPFLQTAAPILTKADTPPASPTDCSVCLASYPPSLAVLQPCAHPLCSACLTSALNIVGEKDMQCAVCNRKVADFKLVSIKKPAGDSLSIPHHPPALAASPRIRSFGGGLPDFPTRDVDSPFDLGFDPSDIRASTPKLEHQMSRASTTAGPQNIVLRIDNVPWDITPRQIMVWLQQPVERVHVLLDNKGKTLSHAYVEIKDASVAGAILRGETIHPNGAGRKERGSVLGKGKRARGVTVTRSTQEELMANLFPHWRGKFEGSKPVAPRREGGANLRNAEPVLLSEGEINALRHLIQSPDSHFLKVPVLPFHSLISLLSKFPADADSRAFWTPAVLDRLFDAARIGLEELFLRVEKAQRAGTDDGEHTMGLVHDLAKVAMNCRVFTSDQIRRFTDLLIHFAIPIPDIEDVPETPSEQGSSPVGLHTPCDHDQEPQMRQGATFADLAKEFGVEAQLVQALAHRLAGLQ